AGFARSEMVTSDARLWSTSKTRHRLDHSGEPGPTASRASPNTKPSAQSGTRLIFLSLQTAISTHPRKREASSSTPEPTV
ncbi:MAG: hypothetical protein V3U59_03765, partial [Gammaproteobacteria bacterium]